MWHPKIKNIQGWETNWLVSFASKQAALDYAERWAGSLPKLLRNDQFGAEEYEDDDE